MQQGYDDILSRPRPDSTCHAPMPRIDRAAQFAPFAALTGFEAAVREAARLTETRPELDESRKEQLNRRLQLLKIHREARPQVLVRYFKPDERKAGGACVTVSGPVKKVDDFNRCLTMADGTVIPMEDILDIEAELISREEEHVF